MKTLKFINGDIEFYPSKYIAYDKKYLRNSTGKSWTFNDYKGEVGLNDCVIGVYKNANIKGYLSSPAYIDTAGDIDLIVHPSMELSIKTTKQGFVDDVAMENRSGRYEYGASIQEHANYYFSNFFIDTNFEVLKNPGSFFASRGKQHETVTFLDLCAESNLICIDVIKTNNVSIIKKGYTEEYVALAKIAELHNILNISLENEDYKLAAIVKKEINRIRNT